jgi:hypothetical protein
MSVARSTGRVSPVQRYTRAHPCPTCGGWDGGKGPNHCYGHWLSDGRGAFCTRLEFANGLPWQGTSGYLHWYSGPCKCGETHDAAAVLERERIPEHHELNTNRAHERYSPIALHEYRDAGGEIRFRVARFYRGGAKPAHYPEWLPKCMPQRPDGRGGWYDGIACAGILFEGLYRLPELLAADPLAPVWIVGGELCVDALAARDQVATTNAGGEHRPWQPEYNEPLRGRYVIILADADEAGRKHAQEVAESLVGVAASVRILELEEAHDVADWLDAGHAIEQLRRLAAAAPIYTARQPEIRNSTPECNFANGATSAACPACGSTHVSVQLVTSCQDCGAVERRDESPETLNSTPECNFADEDARAEAPLDDLAAVRRIEGYIDAAKTMNSSTKTIARAFLRAMRDLPHEKRIVDPKSGRIQVVQSYRDPDGRVNIPAEFIAEYAGCSPSTVYRQMSNVQYAGIADVHQETWYTEDGAPRKRNYYSLGPNAIPRREAPVFPEPQPTQAKRNGGARPHRLVRVPDECGKCHSRNVEVLATLHCHDCGADEALNLSRPDGADTVSPASYVHTQRCDAGTQDAAAGGWDPRAQLLALAAALDWQPRLKLRDGHAGGDEQAWRAFTQGADMAVIRAALEALQKCQSA